MDVEFGIIGIGEKKCCDPCLICDNGFTINGYSKSTIYALKEELEKDGETLPVFYWAGYSHPEHFYGWVLKEEEKS